MLEGVEKGENWLKDGHEVVFLLSRVRSRTCQCTLDAAEATDSYGAVIDF